MWVLIIKTISKHNMAKNMHVIQSSQSVFESTQWNIVTNNLMMNELYSDNIRCWIWFKL